MNTLSNQNTERQTALYMRLSQEDERSGESMSITNQRQILGKFAEENGFVNLTEYIDDGYSGGNYDRPAFKKMLEEAEKGHISAILCKDLSRMGRDYIMTGYYTEEVFPRLGVRFVAIGDNVDSKNSNPSGNYFAAIKNVFNDMFLYDCSRKGRAAKRAKAERGERLQGRAPYGFMRMDTQTLRIIPNPETAPVVRMIFDMCVNGANLAGITKELKKQKVSTPDNYYHTKNLHSDDENECMWSKAYISIMLESEDYIGNTCNLKTTTTSHKNHKAIHKPREEWVITTGTHEPVIDCETWEIVQRLRCNKKRKNNLGVQSMFSGILFCADCNSKLTVQRRTGETEEQSCYVCSGARNYRIHCQPHRVTVGNLNGIVLEEIRRATAFARNNEREFAEIIRAKSNGSAKKQLVSLQREYDKQTKRIAELDRTFRMLYDDKVNGEITAEQFKSLSKGYTAEQESLEQSSVQLLSEIEKLKSEQTNIDKFIALAKKYTDISELTPEILHTFVNKIVVHNREYFKRSGKNTVYSQQIDVHFTNLGFVESDAKSISQALEESGYTGGVLEPFRTMLG